MNVNDNNAGDGGQGVDPILAALEKSGQVVPEQTAGNEGGQNPAPTAPANPPAGDPPVNDPISINRNNDGGQQSQNPTPNTPPANEPPQQQAGGEGEQALNHFLSRLGVTTPPEIKPDEVTLDVLADIAKAQIDSVKTQYAAYENPQVRSLIEHISGGGSLEDYVNQPQKSNYWGSLTLEATQIEQQEAIMTEKFKNSGIPADTIEILIEGLKNSNKLYSSALAEVEVNKQAEIAYNKTIDDQLAASREETKKFFSNVNKMITENSVGVLTIHQDDIEEFRNLSVQNQAGEIGIQKILDGLNDQQLVALNYVAYRMTKGDNISFGKAGTPQSQSIGTKPIAAILGKATTNNLAGNTANSDTFRELLKQS